MPDNEQRPICRRCGARLVGAVVDDHTVCPDCGKTWRLTPAHDAIYTQPLAVHDAMIGSSTQYTGEHNG